MPKRQISLRRQMTDYFFTGLAASLSVVVVCTLIAIFAYLVLKGTGSLNWSFLTQTPKPVGEPGGGMANALLGSVMILGIASLFGVPVGIGAGIYLAEYGRNRLGQLVRFTSDVLNGVPSIVIGLVAYGLVVIPQRHFSAFAGGVALAIMMVPTVARTTEEMLLLVPQCGPRSSLWTGHSAVANDNFHYPGHCSCRHHHRRHAGLCPGRGRNGAADVHRVWKPVLEFQCKGADRCTAAADFHLRDYPL